MAETLKAQGGNTAISLFSIIGYIDRLASMISLSPVLNTFSHFVITPTLPWYLIALSIHKKVMHFILVTRERASLLIRNKIVAIFLNINMKYALRIHIEALIALLLQYYKL